MRDDDGEFVKIGTVLINDVGRRYVVVDNLLAVGTPILRELQVKYEPVGPKIYPDETAAARLTIDPDFSEGL